MHEGAKRGSKTHVPLRKRTSGQHHSVPTWTRRSVPRLTDLTARAIQLGHKDRRCQSLSTEAVQCCSLEYHSKFVDIYSFPFLSLIAVHSSDRDVGWSRSLRTIVTLSLACSFTSADADHVWTLQPSLWARRCAWSEWQRQPGQPLCQCSFPGPQRSDARLTRSRQHASFARLPGLHWLSRQ